MNRSFIALGLTLTLWPHFAQSRVNPGTIIRWTGAENSSASFSQILSQLNEKTHQNLKLKDFQLQEDRLLAFSRYQRWVQLRNQIPIRGKSIRIWSERNTQTLIQMEAALAEARNPILSSFQFQLFQMSPQALQESMSSEQTLHLAQAWVQARSEDPFFLGAHWEDEWDQDELFRWVSIRGKRGTSHLQISLRTQQVVAATYQEFPQADSPSAYNSRWGQLLDPVVKAQVYPIYEEASGEILNRIPVQLKYLSPFVPRVNGDIYAELKKDHYYSSKYNPLLGSTPEGKKQGYWSMESIKKAAAKIRSKLPQELNQWRPGILLYGRFATINIHPDAISQFKPSSFQPISSPALFPEWISTHVGGTRDEEMIPSTAYYGKPIHSADEAWNRPARRLADHDPKTYLDDGFDEIQVYYAINTLFDELRSRGFTDPELSTRPFHAFLFNPDITYRDNAYYTDDTINFTTYSSQAENAARDNTTIWHELGHGLMDRLMGEHLELADTGGLSEGMADFLAAALVQAVSEGKPFPGYQNFRIMNSTGFYLTNEVHDDGEAYGGTMKDLMDQVLKTHGQNGLTLVVDLVLETMRLTRDHPSLDAKEWFNHLLFADSLGRAGVREPGELRDAILSSLAGRNFKLNDAPVAQFSVKNTQTDQELTLGAPGTRNSPIRVSLPASGSREFQLKVQLKGSDQYTFDYPLQLRVQFNGGALQGAIHWNDEETGARLITLNSEAESALIPLSISGQCESVNRPDGSCVDYVSIQVLQPKRWDRPIAKKRFYIHLKTQ